MSIRERVRETMASHIDNPEYSNFFLNANYHKANVGLAWNRFNIQYYLTFEGDYIELTSLPTFQDGILSMEGRVKNGANLLHGDHHRVLIRYKSPPQELTRGQLARSYGVCYGPWVAFLTYRSGGSQSETWEPCFGPYAVPPESPAPNSALEANQLWEEARSQSNEAVTPEAITVPVIKMSRFDVEGDEFAIRADVQTVLDSHGPGVYMVEIWGIVDGAAELISEYTIFHGIPRPTGYGPR